MDKQERFLADDRATLTLGAMLANACTGNILVFLVGDLGAGKTTLVRGWLNGMGFSGTVKSPTYTLVEPYEFAERHLYHFDLYRLGDPDELEYLGGRDYFSGDAICLVEWPERGQGWLPEPDLVIELAVQGEGRKASLIANTELGSAILAKI